MFLHSYLFVHNPLTLHKNHCSGDNNARNHPDQITHNWQDIINAHFFVIVMNIIYSSHIIHLWKKAHNYEIRIQRIDM